MSEKNNMPYWMRYTFEDDMSGGMMIKLPKEYQTLRLKNKIRRVPGNGGYFNSAVEVIEIGRDLIKDIDVIVTLVHEMLEASCAIHGYRYESGNEINDFVFVMTHKQFDNITEEFARGILDLINANKVKK